MDCPPFRNSEYRSFDFFVLLQPTVGTLCALRHIAIARENVLSLHNDGTAFNVCVTPADVFRLLFKRRNYGTVQNNLIKVFNNLYEVETFCHVS